MYSYTVKRTNLDDKGEEQINNRIMRDIELEEQNLLYSIDL